MMKADNDNERFSFLTLQAATRNVVEYLTQKEYPPEGEKRPADSNDGKAAEQHPDEHRRYIEHRLREIAAWERRISGKK